METSIQGRWPVIDLVLVKDYEQSAASSAQPACYLRIHMDIPVKEDDMPVIDGLLKKSDAKSRKAIYDKVMNSEVTGSPRAVATLKGALEVT